MTCRSKKTLDSQSLGQQEAPLGVGVNYHQLMTCREREACSGWNLALRESLPGDQRKVASDRVSVSRTREARCSKCTAEHPCFPAPVPLSFHLQVRTSSPDSIPVFSIPILDQKWTFMHLHVPITISKALSIFCSFPHTPAPSISPHSVDSFTHALDYQI